MPQRFGPTGTAMNGYRRRRTRTAPAAVLAMQRLAGNRAVATLCAGSGPTPAATADDRVPGAVPGQRAPLVVQRATRWYQQDAAGVLTAFGDGLGALAEEAAAEVLAKPDAVSAVSGYVDQWHTTYQQHMAGVDVTAFLHARFGYAVEALTCAKITAGRLAVPQGWRVDFQVAAGMTRPDVVVTDDTGAAQGWFDITSEASVGHILRKAGSQWATRPYVAEALYPALRITDLQVSGSTAADTVKRRSLARQERATQQQLMARLAQHARAVYHDMAARAAELTGDTRRRRAFEEAMHAELTAQTDWVPGGTKLVPRAATSLLDALDSAGERCPSGRPWMSTMGYTGPYARGRDRLTLSRILEHLAP